MELRRFCLCHKGNTERLSEPWLAPLADCVSIWKVPEGDCCTGGEGTWYCINSQKCLWYNGKSSLTKGCATAYFPKKSQKDKLYNDILTFCEKEQLLWKADKINTLGWALCNVFVIHFGILIAWMQTSEVARGCFSAAASFTWPYSWSRWTLSTVWWHIRHTNHTDHPSKQRKWQGSHCLSVLDMMLQCDECGLWQLLYVKESSTRSWKDN